MPRAAHAWQDGKKAEASRIAAKKFSVDNRMRDMSSRFSVN